MNRIRKGDQVIVIAGADKGKKGEVVRVSGDKVVVQNVHIIKRHTKANPQSGQAGGNMMDELGKFDVQRQLANLTDWSDRIAKGELPKSDPAPSASASHS